MYFLSVQWNVQYSVQYITQYSAYYFVRYYLYGAGGVAFSSIEAISPIFWAPRYSLFFSNVYSTVPRSVYSSVVSRVYTPVYSNWRMYYTQYLAAWCHQTNTLIPLKNNHSLVKDQIWLPASICYFHQCQWCILYSVQYTAQNSFQSSVQYIVQYSV